MTVSRIKQRQRGFTLVELLITVAIIGVLSAVAIVGYRKWVDSSKNAEVGAMIGAIRSTMEAYRAETMGYLDVSQSGKYYPQDTSSFSTSKFNSKKHSWTNSASGDYDRWRTLAVVSDGPVRFGYKVRAGAAGTQPAAAPFTIGNWPAGNAPEPWYVIDVVGDPDEDGVPTKACGSSFSSEIFWDNP